MVIYNVGLLFEIVQMDILKLFSVSYFRNSYLLVIVYSFTKWVKTFPISNVRTKIIADILYLREISNNK